MHSEFQKPVELNSVYETESLMEFLTEIPKETQMVFPKEEEKVLPKKSQSEIRPETQMESLKQKLSESLTGFLTESLMEFLKGFPLVFRMVSQKENPTVLRWALLKESQKATLAALRRATVSELKRERLFQQ